MNVRKLNKHRAKLSFEKRWLYTRKGTVLIMWTQSSNYKGGR
jgi:hypothetical protein